LRIEDEAASKQAANSAVLYEAGVIPKSDLDAANVKAESSKAAISTFSETEKLNLEQSMETIKKTITELQYAVKKAENELLSYSKPNSSAALTVEKLKLDTLSAIDLQIREKEDEIKAVQNETRALEVDMESFKVIAPSSGTLNLVYQLAKGELLAPGTEIGSIVPDVTDSFRITLSVSNKDIASVKAGQKIKLKFLALPYQEYGSAEGTVLQISSDSRSDNTTGESYYTIEASVENKPIKSYKGNDEYIRVGMAVEGQVISGTKSLLRYALEKLNFA
jgi:HlyD family secretion protein